MSEQATTNINLSAEERKANNVVDKFEGYSDEAKDNAIIFRQLRSFRNDWIKDRIKNDDFYHGVHYSPREEEDIEAMGQSPLPINITYSVIKQIISLVTSQQPTWNVYPVNDKSKEFAYTGRELLNATWYNSRGNRVLSNIVKDTAIAGVGYGISLPEDEDEGFFVRYDHVPYWYVYVSPNTAKFDYRDAENIIISKLHSVKQVADLFNTTVEEVSTWTEEVNIYAISEDFYPKYSKPTVEVLTANTTEKQQLTRKIRVIERFSMEKKTVYIVEGNASGNTFNFSLPRRIYFTKTDEIKNLEAKGLIKCTEQTRRVVARYLSAGGHCEVEYYPISQYHIVPYIDEFRNSPYPLGTVDFLYGLQRALNKFILLAILNAALSSNMKIMYPKGSIDEDLWAKLYTVPGAQLAYTWEKDVPPPQQINPVALPSTFFEFPEKFVQLIEYVTGIYGIMQGNPDGAPRTNSGLQSLQAAGGQKVQLLTRNITDALTAQGDITLQMYQNYSPYNQQLMYIEDGEMKSIEYNKTSIENGELFVDKDISQAKFKTRVTIEPNIGNARQAKANILSNLAMQTKSPELIPYILKLIDLPEADEVAKKMDIVARQGAQIGQMQEDIKRLNQINEQLQNEVIQKSQDVEMSKFKSNLDAFFNDLEKKFGIQFEKETAKMREELTNLQQSKQPENKS